MLLLLDLLLRVLFLFFFSSRRRHTRCALVTGVQTCALPIFPAQVLTILPSLPSAPCSPRAGAVAARKLCGLCGPDGARLAMGLVGLAGGEHRPCDAGGLGGLRQHRHLHRTARQRSEEHTSELQSLMRISYAVFCLKKKKTVRVHDSSKVY